MDSKLQQIQHINNRFFTIRTNYLRARGQKGYLRYRMLRPLIKLVYKTFRKTHAPAPWLSQTSIRFFSGYLTKEMRGCEFGSGISTLFFAPKVGSLVSVEHNAEWAGYIRTELSRKGITNVDYRQLSQNDPALFENTTFEMETKHNFVVRRDYVNYFMALDQEKDESFDFIIVDGRARPECVYYAMPKLKKNGLMILDNSEREHYKFVFELCSSWEMVNTTNGLTDTTFWVKPG